MELLERLATYKEQKNMSYEKLGELLGVSYATVYKWLTQRRNISPRNREKIAELLNNEMREQISIPLETLEEIKQVSPSLESLITDLFKSNGTFRVGLIEKQIAEKAIGLPLSIKALYGLSACLIGQEFKKE